MCSLSSSRPLSIYSVIIWLDKQVIPSTLGWIAFLVLTAAATPLLPLSGNAKIMCDESDLLSCISLSDKCNSQAFLENKILLLVYKALNGTGPEYIHELLTVQEGIRDLRSVHNIACLKEPRSKLVTGGDRNVEKAAAVCKTIHLFSLETLTH